MSPNLETDLLGMINHLPDFKKEALLPVFEAIYNSIDAIEERRNLSSGEIIIRIIRQPALPEMGSSKIEREIINFEIEDNGIGFNNKNFDSFSKIYTRYKLSKGGKGIGRLCWLKAFHRVNIESIYKENGIKRERIIKFDLQSGIKQKTHRKTKKVQKTIVKLLKFKKEYKIQESAYRRRKKIAQRILEHCLSYLIEDFAPSIYLIDEDKKISITKLFKTIKPNINTKTITKKGIKFKLTHIKLYSTYSKKHKLVLCANNREVVTYDFQKLLGTSMLFDKEKKKYYYAVYVSSPYLDNNVDNSRIRFNIPREKGTLYELEYPISIDDIKELVKEQAKGYLSEDLIDVIKQKEEVVHNFISKENPSLRAVPTYCPEVYDEIEPNISKEKLHEVLYKHKGKAEYQMKNNLRLLKTQPESIAEIIEKNPRIIEEIDAFQKGQLAGYIVFRKMIIDLLSNKMEQNRDGKYTNEDIIHDIFFPRKTTTAEIPFENYNLWLIDERLTFHDLACSDIPLCDIIKSKSKKRPDILIFSEMNEDKVARAVSIIELKKPQRTKYPESPVDQIFSQLRKIQNGKVKLPNGRKLITNETTRFYCFAICDLTDKIIEFAENNDYATLMGELGYYTYNRNLNAHIEIIDYDKIIVDVKQRHKAFFDRLGI